MAYLKNIASSEVLKLADQVQYAAGQVVSKTLVQNKGVGITLFAFAKGEGISEHESTGDAFVTCLDGKGKIMIDGKPYFLEKGESIVMPANHPHAVYGGSFSVTVRDRKKPDPPSYTAIFSGFFKTRGQVLRISVEKKGDFFCGKPSFQFRRCQVGNI